MLESIIDRITKASLKYKWVTIGLAVFAIVAGGISLTQFNQELIPGIEFPQTVVLAFNSGAEVEDMLTEVTIPIEDAVSEIEGVVNVESTTNSGVAFIIVRNEFGFNQDKLREQIQASIDAIDYPEGMETPELLTFSFADLPVASISVSSDQLSLAELKEIIDAQVVPGLESAKDVANVQVSGGQELPTEPPATPEPTPEVIPEATPVADDAITDGVKLPVTWTAAFAAQGITLQFAEELNAGIVGGLASFAPDMLNQLTPEMLLAMPIDALGAIPEEFFANLDAEILALLQDRLAELPSDEELDPGLLPAPWQAAAAVLGLTMSLPEDVTPEFIQALAGFGTDLFTLLTPEHLLRFSPEVLGWLPPEYIDMLEDEALLTELESLAAPVGGLSALAIAAAEAAAELSADAPALSGLWLREPEEGAPGGGSAYETAADLINNGFMPSAAEFLNVFLTNGPPHAPEQIGDLTPDVIAWLDENEEDFLINLSPSILRILSPEVLDSLPEEFLTTLDADLSEELALIASGELTTFIPTDTITRTNGNPSLSISVFKESGSNTVEVSHAMFDEIAILEEEYPNLLFDIVFEQASFIEESISGVTREGGLGAIFAVIIILLFLSGQVGGKYRLSLRSTIVTAVSIPLSVFMAFALLRWLPNLTEIIFAPLVEATEGIPILGAAIAALHRLFPLDVTLNIMTLSGMTVAIGRVVDDSIVVLENIYRHIQRGDDMRDSVLVGTRDVAIAIFASTVTTVIVFLPIGLLGGLIGEFFLPFGVAVTYALASSFIVAITIVPLFAYMFIRKEHLPEERETTMQKVYTPVLEWALNHRALSLGIATVVFIGSMVLLSDRPRAFLPDFGEPQITVSVDLPAGTKIVDTDDLVATFEHELESVDGLGVLQVSIGSGGGFEAAFFGQGIDQSAANLQMGVEVVAEADQLTAEVRELAEDVFGNENVIVSIGSFSSGAFGGFGLILSGSPEELAAVNDDAIAALNEVEGLANVSSNLADSDSVLRVDGESAVRFSGELETEDALGVTELAKAEIENIIPETITVSEGFETRQQTEGFQQAIQAIMISIVAVYIVMVATFRSFIHPFTILFSLPLAIIGASVALWLTDRVLGLPVMIGLMMLVGIVVTNAIVLMYRVQANRNQGGMTTYDAIVEGGRTRLRPILMTAIAAMLALVPLALGLTEGAIIAAELATVVIGGLFSSTLLTLVIVPVMYSVLEKF